MLAGALALPAAAPAADNLFIPVTPLTGAARPQGFRVDAAEALAIAKRQSKVQREAEAGALDASAYQFGGYWLVRMTRSGVLRAQVEIDGRSGAVQWADVGREIDWPPIAHGEHAGEATTLHWLMLAAALLFLVPFADPRRLARMRNLDLLAVVALGVSFAFAEHGRVYTATPLIYPPLLYLLGRCGWIALRGRGDDGPLTWVSPRVLLVALGALLAARYAYVVAAGQVSDVGYASLVGADSIVHGYALYDPARGHLDAYGPIAYLAYVPFVLVWPTHNLAHTSVQAAQSAAIVFDLATVAALVAVGRRLRAGPEGKLLGLCLAWGFAACPWTLFVLARATNDGLVALLLTLVLLAFASPLLRGLALGAGVAAKFGPLALAPLFARVGRERSLRDVAIFGAALVLLVAVAVGAYLPDGGLHEFYERTLGFQLSRHSPFSIWGLHPAWEPLRPVVTGAAALAAAAAFLLPRERSLVSVAAAGAALVIASQLTAIHWYWFYVPWFLPYALVAFLSRSYAGSVRNSGSSSASAVASNSS